MNIWVSEDGPVVVLFWQFEKKTFEDFKEVSNIICKFFPRGLYNTCCSIHVEY